jgi:hypothetical protein
MSWKLCSRENGELYSFSIPKGRGRRSYKIGVPSKRLLNAGPLTAFRTLRNLRLFATANCNQIKGRDIVIVKTAVVSSCDTKL